MLSQNAKVGCRQIGDSADPLQHDGHAYHPKLPLSATNQFPMNW